MWWVYAEATDWVVGDKRKGKVKGDGGFQSEFQSVRKESWWLDPSENRLGKKTNLLGLSFSKKTGQDFLKGIFLYDCN